MSVYCCSLSGTLACKYCSNNPEGVYKEQQYYYTIGTDGCQVPIQKYNSGVVPYWKFNEEENNNSEEEYFLENTFERIKNGRKSKPSESL